MCRVVPLTPLLSAPLSADLLCHFRPCRSDFLLWAQTEWHREIVRRCGVKVLCARQEASAKEKFARILSIDVIWAAQLALFIPLVISLLLLPLPSLLLLLSTRLGIMPWKLEIFIRMLPFASDWIHSPSCGVGELFPRTDCPRAGFEPWIETRDRPMALSSASFENKEGKKEIEELLNVIVLAYFRDKTSRHQVPSHSKSPCGAVYLRIYACWTVFFRAVLHLKGLTSRPRKDKGSWKQ